MSAPTSRRRNPSQGSENEDSPAAVSGVSGKVFRFVRRVFATSLCVLFLICIYLTIAGVPPRLVQKWVSQLHARGVYVEVARIRLDLLYGFAADGFRFFDSPDRRVPMLEADRIILSFNPLEWFDREAGLTDLQIKGAALRINADGKLESRKSMQNMALDRVNARVRIEPGGIRIIRASASILDVDIYSQAFIVRHKAKLGKKMTLEEFSEALAEILGNLPSWLPSLFEQLNAIRFGESPRADLNFTLYPTNPALTEASLHVRGFSTQVRGISFDSWDLEARLENGRLAVSSLNLRYGPERCNLTASMDVTNGMAELRMFSSLPLNHWLCLIPREWSKALKCENMPDSGHAMFELWGGPAPVGKIAEHLTGWLSLDDVNLHGVWVDKGFVSFRRDGAELSLKKIDAIIGRGRQKGPLRGHGSLRLDTHEFVAHADSECDPNAVLSLLTRNQACVIRSLVFKQTPPSLQMDVSGDFDNPKRFQMKGRFRGTNFSYNGAAITSFDSEAAVSNGVLTFHSMTAARKEGRVEGLIAIDFDNEKVILDATSTCDPYMVGRIIGPNAEEFLRMFRFEGPAHVTARGVVDFGAWKTTDIQGSAEFQNAGMDWLLIDQGRFDLRMLGAQLFFTNIVGSVYDGSFTGHVSFAGIDQASNVSYRVEGSATNIDFSRLMFAMRQVGGDPYKGSLSGEIAFGGVVGKDTCRTVTGEGHVSIKNGYLFQVRLLGGLSKLLSRIYPGLGFASQTDFSTSFKIRDCKMHSDNAFLEGSVVSASGQGSYGFNETLDMNVQVHLLRAGLVASVVRAVTFPVTKLLEFNLSGSLKEPRWRPVNLPKELFLIFD